MAKDQKVQRLQKSVDDLKKEMESDKLENGELKERNKTCEQEICDVYSSLRRKEEVLKGLEQRLSMRIKERDEEIIGLKSKLVRLENQSSKENQTMMTLKNEYNEKSEHTSVLQRRINEKENHIVELKSEITRA